MTSDAGLKWQDVLCISEVAADNLKQARRYFAEVFGMKADGKEIDAKIRKLFDEACNHLIDGESVNTTVAVPIELILAITLREGFDRKTGRRRKSPIRRHNIEFAVRWAKRRAAEWRQTGMRLGLAKERAIEEAEDRFGHGSRPFYGVDASIIRNNWSKID